MPAVVAAAAASDVEVGELPPSVAVAPPCNCVPVCDDTVSLWLKPVG